MIRLTKTFARNLAGRVKKVGIVVVVVAVVICMVMYGNEVSITKQHIGRSLMFGVENYVKSKRTEKYDKEEDRPIIYTFYNKIDDELKNTGMTDRADEDLLKLWKGKWNEAGWDARVLNLEDAKQHPRFEEFETKLKQVPIHGMNVAYNELCYYRWLAVAAVGGGWMSDYDLMPLNFHYPDEYFENGRFAIYSTSGLGGIPCLMSGSESEWERLAFAILENGSEHDSGEHLWSDMFASIDVYVQDHSAYKVFDLVTEVKEIKWNEETCNEYNGKLGLHFSHSALRKMGIYDFNLRPEFAGHWMNDWKSTCKDYESIDMD